MKTIKKIIVLALAILMLVSLVACGNNDSESVESVEDKVISAVKSQIIAETTLSYDISGVPDITFYVDEIGENEFEVTGKVTVKDKYGDSYTGKYDATVEYDPSLDDCDVDCNIGDLYKD